MRKTRYMRPNLNYFAVQTPDPLGVIRYAPEGEQAGGGGGATTVEKKEEKKEEKKAEAKKLELTEEEFQAKIEKAKETERVRLQKERDKEKEQEKEETAKKQGEFQKLYETEVEKGRQRDAEVATLKLDGRKRDVKDELRKYVEEKHPNYSKSVDWIWKGIDGQVSLDAKPEDLTKLVKENAEAFVKDNPLAVRQGAPLPPSHGKTTREIPAEKKDDNGSAFHPTSVVANRF